MARRSASGIGWLGYTAISSANGASVASTRAPRTRMPCSVSSTLCNCVSSKPVGTLPLDLSIVAWIKRVRQAEILAAAAAFGRQQDSRHPRSLPFMRPFVGAAGEAGIGHVHIVGGAAHQPDRELGDPAQRLMPAQQVLAGAGDDVADGDGLAGVGVGHQTVVGVLIMQVEDGGDGFGGASEVGVVERIGDARGAEPDFSAVAQSAQEGGAGAGWHGWFPPVVAFVWGAGTSLAS